jgi:hypothetical protein
MTREKISYQNGGVLMWRLAGPTEKVSKNVKNISKTE